MENLDTAYTEQQFDAALKETFSKKLEGKVPVPVENPEAVLLGGQSGAGKSTLHRIFRESFDFNVVVINGDEYRKSHPRFQEIQSRYGLDAPAHTAQWSGRMTESLIDKFSEKQYNLVIEGTLRTSDVPVKTATLLRDRGYRTSLAIMAVKPEISLVSCQIRYEMMRIAGTTPRSVDPEHHNKIVRDIADNLSTLEQSGLFEDVRLYNRSAECLFPAVDARPTASETLQDVLFGSWTSEEEAHHASLARQLEELKGM